METEVMDGMRFYRPGTDCSETEEDEEDGGRGGVVGGEEEEEE